MWTGQVKSHFPVQDTGKYHFYKMICFSRKVYQKAIAIQTSAYKLLWRKNLLFNIICKHDTIFLILASEKNIRAIGSQMET